MANATKTKKQPAPKKPLHPAEQYALDVVKGKVRAGRLVKLACKRHRRDLKEQKKRGLLFVPENGQHAIDFFENYLIHFKGDVAGEPFTLGPWQQFIIWNLFGWYRRDDEKKLWRRRFNTAYVQVAKKNVKSTLAAGILVYCMLFDGEAAAECYAAAVKRDQAKIVFDAAKRFIQKNPALAAMVDVLTLNLNVKSTGSKLEPLSSDSKGLDGLNTHVASVDEFHAHPTRDVLDAIETSMIARLNPLTVIPTTAGAGQHSPCRELRDFGVDVLEGKKAAENQFFYIAELDEKDDWTDPKNWVKANPNLGVSVSLDQLNREVQKAIDTPGYQNRTRRFHLDQWMEQVERWLDMGHWDKCTGGVDVDTLETILRGRECWAGLDLASTTDLAAFTAVFPDDETGGFDVLFRVWIPKETIEKRSKDDGVPYQIWADAGLVTPTPGNVIDHDQIRLDINNFHETYQIMEIAFDRWNAAQITTQLMGDGFTVVPFGQGYASMNAPSKEFEKLIVGHTLRHAGHPVARWCASNVASRTDPAGNIKPDKEKSKEKIDPIVALIMGIGRALVRGENQEPEPGIIFI